RAYDRRPVPLAGRRHQGHLVLVEPEVLRAGVREAALSRDLERLVDEPVGPVPLELQVDDESAAPALAEPALEQLDRALRRGDDVRAEPIDRPIRPKREAVAG